MGRLNINNRTEKLSKQYNSIMLDGGTSRELLNTLIENKRPDTWKELNDIVAQVLQKYKYKKEWEECNRNCIDGLITFKRPVLNDMKLSFINANCQDILIITLDLIKGDITVSMFRDTKISLESIPYNWGNIKFTADSIVTETISASTSVVEYFMKKYKDLGLIVDTMSVNTINIDNTDKFEINDALICRHLNNIEEEYTKDVERINRINADMLSTVAKNHRQMYIQANATPIDMRNKGEYIEHCESVKLRWNNWLAVNTLYDLIKSIGIEPIEDYYRLNHSQGEEWVLQGDGGRYIVKLLHPDSISIDKTVVYLVDWEYRAISNLMRNYKSFKVVKEIMKNLEVPKYDDIVYDIDKSDIHLELQFIKALDAAMDIVKIDDSYGIKVYYTSSTLTEGTELYRVNTRQGKFNLVTSNGKLRLL